MAIATWSTEWNYGPSWEGTLLAAYGIPPDPERTRLYRALWVKRPLAAARPRPHPARPPPLSSNAGVRSALSQAGLLSIHTCGLVREPQRDRRLAYRGGLTAHSEGAPAGREPHVVVFTGLPGTGKSTLADLTAKTLGAPAFAGDWLMGALKPAAAVLAQLDRKTYLELYHGLLRSLVTRQLILGQSAVVDGVVTDEVIAEWRALAERYRATLSIIECVCSDEAVHRKRVEGRIRGIPGWHEIGWYHVQRMRAEFEPPRAERLTVDALSPLESNAEAVLRYLDSARAKPGE